MTGEDEFTLAREIIDYYGGKVTISVTGHAYPKTLRLLNALAEYGQTCCAECGVAVGEIHIPGCSHRPDTSR